MSKTPLYFSNNLEFTLNGKKGHCTDRLKIRNIVFPVFFGFLLVVLGLYELLNGFNTGMNEIAPAYDVTPYNPMISVWVFDCCFIVIGLFVLGINIVNYLRYNKYQIDDSEIIIIQRRLFHGKKTFKEKLNNYGGIRFRTEFLQSGIFTRNRYIIELHHKNCNKSVPLYISTSEKGIRQKWKDFAKKLKLPILLFTDEGIRSVEYKDFSQSLAAQHKKGLITDNFDGYERLPKIFAYVRKKDKIVIKIRKIIWDAYNFVTWFILGVACIMVGVAISVFHNADMYPSSFTYLFTVVLLVIIVILLLILFRKEKLVLKRNKIVHTYKYMLFSTKHNQIKKKDIEGVEINENPATGRYYVSIFSNDNTITFGAKLAIKDLRWLKRFLIHEIVK